MSMHTFPAGQPASISQAGTTVTDSVAVALLFSEVSYARTSSVCGPGGMSAGG
jgi:hypothetical protein